VTGVADALLLIVFVICLAAALLGVILYARRALRRMQEHLHVHDEDLADVHLALQRQTAAQVALRSNGAAQASQPPPSRPQLRVIRGGKTTAWIPAGLTLGALAARSKAFAASHPAMATATVTMAVAAAVGAGYAVHETVTGPGGGAASQAWSPRPGSPGPAPMPAPRRPQPAAPAAPGGEREAAVDVASLGSVTAVIAGLHGGQPERPHDHGPLAAQPPAPRTGDEDEDAEPPAEPSPDVPILDPKRPTGDVEVTVPGLPQTVPEVVGELPEALPEALRRVPVDDLRKIAESKIEACFRECFSQLPTPSHPGS
jgi:hypothetical protein